MSFLKVTKHQEKMSLPALLYLGDSHATRRKRRTLVVLYASVRCSAHLWQGGYNATPLFILKPSDKI